MSRWRSSGITAWTRPTVVLNRPPSRHVMGRPIVSAEAFTSVGGAGCLSVVVEESGRLGVLRGHQPFRVPHLRAPGAGRCLQARHDLRAVWRALAPESDLVAHGVGLPPLSHPLLRTSPPGRHGFRRAVSNTRGNAPYLPAPAQRVGGQRRAGGQEGLWLRRLLAEDPHGQGRSEGRADRFPGRKHPTA